MSVSEIEDHYLFAYFTSSDDEDGEQVRFARSVARDPLHFEILADGNPVLLSTIGTRGVRDPFLLRAVGLPGETAQFYLIATDLRIRGLNPDTAWAEVQRDGSRSIVIWESSDLVEWSAPRLVELAPTGAGNAWAPEAIYDSESRRYFVFWASTLHDKTEIQPYNQMLAAWTTDFVNFSETFTWVNPGWSVIDATVVQSGEYFYRVIKDERSATSALPTAKYLTIERSTTLATHDYSLVADGVGSKDPGDGREPLHQGEGPILVWSNEQALWYLFIDEFTLRRYIPFESSDLASGVWRMSKNYEMPPGASHGSILAITHTEWENLGGITPAVC
ncbi:MAG TPA: glycoside hydrolase family 43 protein [Candidatus Nanopelagicaceae bacterium]